MKKFRFTLPQLALFGALIFTSCKKEVDDPQNPQPTTGLLVIETRLNSNQVANFDLFQIGGGSDYGRYQLESLKFYLGDLTLTRNGDPVKLADVLLVDIDKSAPRVDSNTMGYRFTFRVPSGAYTGASFGLGVPSRLNSPNNLNFDIGDYPNNSPLSSNRNMYWTWAQGYRFMIAEGRIDTTTAQNGIPNRAFSYHIGHNELYSDVVINSPFNIGAGTNTSLKLTLNTDKIFEGSAGKVDLIRNPTTHSSKSDSTAFAVARTVQNNSTSAFTLSY